ncbi:hypothetical protein PENSUB_10615 [Penicillium subrubescens]|uniref:Uncharacterized protein n=1 Tax=Penicillium subrubescens TaxID=1316194 RepID=A0A1Q5T8A1_9EURO|nr:hypothetical protein PENSUB_10615 [Penicillium subrubescens]
MERVNQDAETGPHEEQQTPCLRSREGTWNWHNEQMAPVPGSQDSTPAKRVTRKK